jgi:hypothetical protein
MTHSEQQQMPTREEIEASKTPAGAWKRETLAEWGVPWPPPKGWKKAITQTHHAEKPNGSPSAHAREKDAGR